MTKINRLRELAKAAQDPDEVLGMLDVMDAVERVLESVRAINLSYKTLYELEAVFNQWKDN